MNETINWTEQYAAQLIDFYRKAIQTRSYSDEEGDVDKNIIFIKGVDAEKGAFYSVKEQGLAE